MMRGRHGAPRTLKSAADRRHADNYAFAAGRLYVTVGVVLPMR